jgi:hypothetical protein
LFAKLYDAKMLDTTVVLIVRFVQPSLEEVSH